VRLKQDRVLGTLLGMGIGDALGMPVEGWPPDRVIERFGSIDAYHPKTFEDGAGLKAGEFTDDSEGVLCIVESFTANTGEIDPENIRARLEILARGESRRWMHPATLAILDSDESDCYNDNDAGARVTGARDTGAMDTGHGARSREITGPLTVSGKVRGAPQP